MSPSPSTLNPLGHTLPTTSFSLRWFSHSPDLMSHHPTCIRLTLSFLCITIYPVGYRGLNDAVHARNELDHA